MKRQGAFLICLWTLPTYNRIHIQKASTLSPIALSNHYQWFLVVIANVIKKRQMGVSSQIYLSEKLSFSNE